MPMIKAASRVGKSFPMGALEDNTMLLDVAVSPEMPRDELRKRRGRILVTDEMIYEPSFREHVLCLVIPVRIEHRYDLQAFEIVAFCEEFDELSEGEATPDYAVLVSNERLDDGSYAISKVEFSRQ